MGFWGSKKTDDIQAMRDQHVEKAVERAARGGASRAERDDVERTAGKRWDSEYRSLAAALRR